MGRRYFEVKPLLKKYPKSRYYYILGGRGTGKTYPVMQKCIDDYFDGKGVFAYVRRSKEALYIQSMLDLCAPHGSHISEVSKGKYNRLTYYQRRFYLEKWEKDEETGTEIRTDRLKTPIGGAWSMSTWENDKGGDFGSDKGGISNIVLDEALSKGGSYLRDEWAIFQNVIATLVRDRWEQDTKIFMLANPVSKWSNPYFRAMGISKKLYSVPGITEIKYPSEIAHKDGMRAVFAYIAAVTDKDGNVIDVDETRTNVYNTFFAFPNSKGKSRSITSGFWEMDDSNRLPSGAYNDSTKIRTVCAVYQEDIIAIDIMRSENGVYYLHMQPCRRVSDNTYYLTLIPVLDRYALVGLSNGHPITQTIARIYKTGQVYYSDDTTADSWHGFVKESKQIII